MTIETKPFDVKLLDPKIHEKYSPNLFKWLKREPMRDHIRVFKDRQGRFWIGRVTDDDWFHGKKLYQVLCNGTKSGSAAYGYSRYKDFEEVHGFWDDYQRLGRCAIDVDHQDYFLNSDSRFKELGDHRSCTWCGFKQKRVTFEKTVVREHWVEDKP